MSVQYMGSAYRGTCPECGETKTDSGAVAADVAIVRHRLEKHMASIIETAWAQLDEQVDEIMEMATTPPAGNGPDAVEERAIHLAVAKARARGKAEILALLMAPLLPTADHIATEATRRWQVRHGQVEGSPRTPGDGELLAFESPRFTQAVDTLRGSNPDSPAWTEALFVLTGGVAR